MIALHFYKNRRTALVAAFMLARTEAERLSVASVHVPIKLLTTKERERHTKVEALLSKGQNPYTADRLKEDGKNLHGSNAKERVINYEALASESEAMYQERLDKWSERPDVHEDSILDDMDLNAGVTLAPRDPFKLYCSFCGEETNELTATKGNGPARTIVKREPVALDNGLYTIEEKAFHVTDKLVACSGCCLKLQATERFVKNKAGKIIGTEVVNHVKFPAFD